MSGEHVEQVLRRLWRAHAAGLLSADEHDTAARIVEAGRVRG